MALECPQINPRLYHETGQALWDLSGPLLHLPSILLSNQTEPLVL